MKTDFFSFNFHYSISKFYFFLYNYKQNLKISETLYFQKSVFISFQLLFPDQILLHEFFQTVLINYYKFNIIKNQ